jgi:putative ABC transport system permease protein
LIGRVYTQFPTMQLDKFTVSAPEINDLERETRTFSSVAAWFSATANFTGGDRAVSVPRAYVSASLLPTLGVEPAIGRSFTREEDVPHGPDVVLIGYDLWQRSFRGDASVLGKSVEINARPYTIVGVMPKGFDFPGNGAQIWTPLQIDPADTNRGGHNYNVVARMKPGVTLDAVAKDMTDLAHHWSEVGAAAHHIDADRHAMIARSLKAEIVEKAKGLLWIMQGVVFVVLLIACANVSNLLVARADVRRGEIAVRSALGATRWRLSRQLLIESLVLGACGALVGLLITPPALHAMIALLPEGTPRAGEIRIDGAVLIFAIGAAIVASVVFGLAPIVHTRASALREALGAAASRATGGAASIQLRRGLIVAEIALATVLVAGACLFARSFLSLTNVDPGFRAQGLVTFGVLVPSVTAKTGKDEVEFLEPVRDKLAQIPGVDSVALIAALPPRRFANKNDIFFVGKTMPGRDSREPPWNVDYWQFSLDDHLKTLGARMVAGRAFTRDDDERAPLVAVVNESFARTFYPGEDPIGRRINACDPKDPETTIVGVFADIKEDGLDRPAGTEIVFPMRQEDVFSKLCGGALNRWNFVLRTSGDARAIFDSTRAVMAQAAPQIPIQRMQTMEDVLYDEVAQPRFLTAMILGFAAIALVMAIIGVYGVMSYAVVQRSREIGIRMALGAPPSRVLGMLVRQGLVLTTIGVAIGLGLALALKRVLAATLSGLLFGTTSLDVSMLALAVAPLVVVALLASYVPARRAARIRPMLAMRIEA